MCLRNILSGQEKEEFIDKLKERFPVWKSMKINGETQYRLSREPLLTVGINKAGDYNGDEYCQFRTKLTYKPGFHVFINGKDCLMYCHRENDLWVNKYKATNRLKPTKFYAKKEWVTTIGKESLYGAVCLVLSHIEKE
jgi:hypothetical protein